VCIGKLKLALAMITAGLVRETGPNTVSVFRTIDAETQEARLYCYSDQKAKKEQAIRNHFHVRLEEALDKLNPYLTHTINIH